MNSDNQLPNSSPKVCVLGGGSFGTVIANILAQNGYSPLLWVRREEVAKELNETHQNSKYLPGFTLDNNLHASHDWQECVENAEFIFVAIPSKSVKSVAQTIKDYVSPNAIFISLTKGIQAEGFKLMTQVLNDVFPDHPVAVISGPNIAKEIAEQQFSATVVAHPDTQVCEQVAQLLHCGHLRVYPNTDIYGVELAGALKNIYAILIGYVESLGLGQNTKSMLMTRSLAEMSRFAVALGANPLTFLGLAGVGDLLVTCMSHNSRNFRVGYALGSGKSLDEAVEELGQVAEGVNTIKLVREKSQQLDIYMPLVNALYGLLYENKALSELVDELIHGERNTDISFMLHS